MRLLSIASGSSGNCIYVGHGNTHVLVDAGISGKRIEAGLNEHDIKTSDVQGILLTHEHSDHISGLGVLSRRYHIPIYGTKETLAAVKGLSSLGKVEEELFHYIEPEKEFQVGELMVHPFSIPHDAKDPVAYRLRNGDQSVAIATDMGEYNERIVHELKGVDALLLEANHDVHMLETGSYPYPLKRRILGAFGHLSNESSGRLLSRLLHDGMKYIFLGHLSEENNYEALAYETVRLEIAMGKNGYCGKEIPIEVAKRNKPSSMVEF